MKWHRANCLVVLRVSVAGHLRGNTASGLHGCEIACALKQTFAQCKIFLQDTLLVTNFTNLCKRIGKRNKR